MSSRFSFGAQRGVFVPLIGIGLLLLIGILTFAIDLPNKEALSQELRRAMDSAALAGAQQLNGTPDGLREAVAYVDRMLQDNLVGHKPAELDDIELGFYSFPDKKFTMYYPGRDFRGVTIAADTVFEGGVPASAMINSLRVKAHSPAPSIFSNIFGFYGMGDVSGNAVAVADRRPQVCAFPFAIPLCSLFLNQDPNVKLNEGKPERVTTASFEAARQCRRPVYVSEANYAYEPIPRGVDRLDGIVRAAAYAKPEMATYEAGNICGEPGGKTGGSCISLPIMGTFVVPSRDYTNTATDEGMKYGFLANSPPGTLTTDQLVTLLGKFLENSESPPCMNFSIGDRVNTLDNYYGYDSNVNPVTGSSILAPQEGVSSSSSGSSSSAGASSPPSGTFGLADGFDAIVAELIRGGSSGSGTVTKGRGRYLFRDVFGDPSQSGTFAPKENYPYLRGNAPESQAIGYGQVKVVAGAMREGDFTNPLCHYDKWGANDKDAARVLKVVVPLVVPYQPEGSTALAPRYCDPQSQVGVKTYTLQSSPNSGTPPQVVGFIEANIFDFNFRWLPNTGHTVADVRSGPITDSIPMGGLVSGFSSNSSSGNGGSGDKGDTDSGGNGSSGANGASGSSGSFNEGDSGSDDTSDSGAEDDDGKSGALPGVPGPHNDPSDS